MSTGRLSRAAGLVGAFVRLGRPLFLVGGFINYGLGAAVAVATGHGLDLRRYLLGQAAVTAFHLMTHYANDFFDYEADRANATPTRWSGGSRVLPGGELPRVVALIAALLLAALGVGLSLGVAGSPAVGPWAGPALAAVLVLSWGYSAPPLRLHSTGLGELDTAVVVTGLVPFVGFYLQAPDLTGWPTLLAACLPLACLQFAMLIAIEFPDAAGDAAVGKRTLVVRLGARGGAWLYGAAVAMAFVAVGLGAGMGWLPWFPAALAGALAPLGAWRIRRIAVGDHLHPRRWESVTFWAVALLVAVSMALLLGFMAR